MDDAAERVVREVVDAGLKVHRALGPGLLEAAYEQCLAYELETRRLTVERQVPLPIVYEDLRLEGAYRLDLLVDRCVIVEVKAVEALDACLSRIVAAIEEANGELLITADHGNVEQMLDAETQQPLTSHTNGPVPLVYVGGSGKEFTSEGSLCDLAPTLLSLLDLTIPAQMTGKDLLS